MRSKDRRKSLSFCFAAVLSAFALATPVVIQACPNCVVNVEDSSPSTGTSSTGDSGQAPGVSGSMAAGYFYSILFMIAVFFTLLTGVIFAIRREVQRDAAPLESLTSNASSS